MAGKKIRKVRDNVDRNKDYTLVEAIKLVKSNAQSMGRKFDETVEISMNLNVDPRVSDQAVRGMVQMPNGTGKTVRVAVFARGEKADAALAAGADVVGAEDLAEKITGGFLDFDRVIATPDMMVVVGKLGRVLGTRGLMPNPKLGTVTPNVAEAVQLAKAGSVEYRADKGGVVHAGIGKASFSDDALLGNIQMFVKTITKARPASVKGTYVNRLSISSTMGPGLKVDIASVNPEA